MNSLVCIGIFLTILNDVGCTEKLHPNIFAPPRKWITELFSDVEKEFSMELAINPKCRSDFRIYISHLRNQSVWAVRMKESSEWPSVGLYSGMVDHLGNWAECIKSSGPESIRGKYCISQVVVKNFSVNHYDSTKYLTTVGSECEDCSAWSMLKTYSDDIFRFDRRKIQWAMCIPSSCSSEDLEKSLESIATPIFENNDVTVEVNVPSYMCSTRVQESEKYTKEYYITCCIFLSLIILVIAVTIIDINSTKYNDTKGLLGQSLACFSAKRNLKRLVEYTDKTKNPVYFFKSLFTLFTAITHRWTLSFGYPIFQAEEMENNQHSGKLFFLSNLNGLDVFFLVSGFLFYRFNVLSMKKMGFPYIGIFTIFRLLKTLPIHGMAIAFVAHIFPHLGDGPFWKSSKIWISEQCQTSWLPNLLGVHNFRRASEMCLNATWYFSADLQVSILGVFLLFVLTKSRRLGMILIVICFILSAIWTSLASYFLNVTGFFVFRIGLPRDMPAHDIRNKLYCSFYPRINPFLLGMLLQIVVEKAQKKNYKPSKTLSLFIFSLSLVIANLVQDHGFSLNSNEEYSILWRSIFSGLYRPFYLLPYSVFCFIYFTSGIGFFDVLFTSKIFHVMSRLGVSFFFSAFIFQLYHVASQRSLMPTSTFLNIYMWSIADIIIALPVAICVYLIVDGPFSNLLALLKAKLLESAYLRQSPEKSHKMKSK